MSIIYVLIICDVGFVKSIIIELETVNFIKEIKEIMGEYDILVKLESDNLNELKNIIPSNIRKIPNIRTTLTLTVVDSQE